MTDLIILAFFFVVMPSVAGFLPPLAGTSYTFRVFLGAVVYMVAGFGIMAVYLLSSLL